MSKTVLLTFDYELFFKKSGSIENCIIKPVNDLIESLELSGSKVTFFIDTLFLHKLKNENDCTRMQYLIIETQLKRLIQQGHRIELHLHPHWQDAVYDNSLNEWKFLTYDNYKLSSLHESEVRELFRSGVNMINDIAREVDPDYKVEAFRAGGWCIEPFDLLKDSFIESGIYVDSSVVPGIFMDSELHNIDFRNAPKYSFYKFKDDIQKVEETGCFIEVPLSTYRISLFEKLYCFVKQRLDFKNGRIYGDGVGISPVRKNKLWKRILKSLFSHGEIQIFSIDGNLPPEFLVRRIFRASEKVITLVAHPKTLTPGSFNFLKLSGEYGIRFLTIKEYVDTLK